MSKCMLDYILLSEVNVIDCILLVLLLFFVAFISFKLFFMVRT